MHSPDLFRASVRLAAVIAAVLCLLPWAGAQGTVGGITRAYPSRNGSPIVRTAQMPLPPMP